MDVSTAEVGERHKQPPALEYITHWSDVSFTIQANSPQEDQAHGKTL